MSGVASLCTSRSMSGVASLCTSRSMSGVASLCTPCVIKFQVLLKQSLQCMYLGSVIKKRK